MITNKIETRVEGCREEGGEGIFRENGKREHFSARILEEEDGQSKERTQEGKFQMNLTRYEERERSCPRQACASIITWGVSAFNKLAFPFSFYA